MAVGHSEGEGAGEAKNAYYSEVSQIGPFGDHIIITTLLVHQCQEFQVLRHNYSRHNHSVHQYHAGVESDMITASTTIGPSMPSTESDMTTGGITIGPSMPGVPSTAAGKISKVTIGVSVAVSLLALLIFAGIFLLLIRKRVQKDIQGESR